MIVCENETSSQSNSTCTLLSGSENLKILKILSTSRPSAILFPYARSDKFIGGQRPQIAVEMILCLFVQSLHHKYLILHKRFLIYVSGATLGLCSHGSTLRIFLVQAFGPDSKLQQEDSLSAPAFTTKIPMPVSLVLRSTILTFSSQAVHAEFLLREHACRHFTSLSSR